jgi:hypothetical protein
MSKLSDYPLVHQRLKALKGTRLEWFRTLVRRWGVAGADVDKVIERKYQRALTEKSHGELKELLMRCEDSGENIDTLDRMLIEIVETPVLEDYPVICSLLESIYANKLNMLRALARKWRVHPPDADAAINEAYLAVRQLRARGEIQALLAEWKETPENLSRLESALSGLLVTYLHFKCQDIVRGYATEGSCPQHVTPDLSPAPFAQIDAATTLKRIDVIVEISHREGRITDRQWAFWQWQRANPEAKQQEFDPSLSPSEITRLKHSLYGSIVAHLLKSRTRDQGQQTSSDHRRIDWRNQ